MSVEKLKIGTRGSPLALKQTEMVMNALRRAYPQQQCEIVIIKTSGDWSPEHGDTPLPEDKGGKSQFAKEIEFAIEAGSVDCGVHSVKDMPAHLPDGLQMMHFLPRNDPRDALLSASGVETIADLPRGAIVGTCSPRRAAILKNLRDDLTIVPIRGNVHTRIMKLCSGQVEATFLALAGLERLGLDKGVEHGRVMPVSPDIMLPACGQGVIGIEFHKDREDLKALFNKIHCEKTGLCVLAERAVLGILNGSCHTPIGIYAHFETENAMRLRAFVSSLDGKRVFTEDKTKTVNSLEDATSLATDIGESLIKRVPKDILS